MSFIKVLGGIVVIVAIVTIGMWYGKSSSKPIANNGNQNAVQTEVQNKEEPFGKNTTIDQDEAAIDADITAIGTDMADVSASLVDQPVIQVQ